MRSARLSLLALLLALSPAQARPKKPAPPPPLPPLVLPAEAPQIEARIAGTPVRLTVDLAGDPVVLLNPDVAARLALAGQDRGLFRVNVGQTVASVPFSRELVEVGGRSAEVRVLTPPAAPDGQAAGSDGVIGLSLLPHDQVALRFRPATSGDVTTSVTAREDSSGSITFAWPLPGQAALDVELTLLRPTSVASVAAASRIAAVGDGRLSGPVRRVEIGFGVRRPVRQLVLARPITIAGLPVQTIDVRLFDWAGKAELPPDAEADDALAVVARRGRQRGWPNVKLGRDVLGHCASISWQRDSKDRARGQFDLVCEGRP